MVAVGGLIFYKKQNHLRLIGGKISKAKVVWLCLAIYIYFPVMTLLVFEKSLPREFQIIFGSVSILMWLRAAGELYLLYGIKQWSPLMGIGHNMLCLSVIFAEVSFLKIFLYDSWPLELLLGLMSCCLVLDSYYAYQFRKIVHAKTKGAEGLWFADDERECFRRLNTLTGRWNWIIISILIISLWGIFK